MAASAVAPSPNSPMTSRSDSTWQYSRRLRRAAGSSGSTIMTFMAGASEPAGLGRSSGESRSAGSRTSAVQRFPDSRFGPELAPCAEVHLQAFAHIGQSNPGLVDRA